MAAAAAGSPASSIPEVLFRRERAWSDVAQPLAALRLAQPPSSLHYVPGWRDTSPPRFLLVGDASAGILVLSPAGNVLAQHATGAWVAGSLGRWVAGPILTCRVCSAPAHANAAHMLQYAVLQAQTRPSRHWAPTCWAATPRCCLAGMPAASSACTCCSIPPLPAAAARKGGRMQRTSGRRRRRQRRQAQETAQFCACRCSMRCRQKLCCVAAAAVEGQARVRPQAGRQQL